MKKTLLASAVVVAMGTHSAVHANATGLTGIWTGTYTFTMYQADGTTPVGGSGVPQAWTWDFDAGTVNINNTTTFFGAGAWTARDITITDNVTNYGPATPGGVNMLFDWGASVGIPVTHSWDVCDVCGGVTALTGTITAGSSVFPGFKPRFEGSISQVPVPAAAWLFGSGLVGLVGIARRRRR